MHDENDPDRKLLDALEKIIQDLQKQPFRFQDFLNDTAQLIYRQLNINSLTIGIKDFEDNLYRYKAFAGLRKSSEDAHKACVYTKNEFFDQSKYPGHIISKETRLFLAEANPYASGEVETYNRPLMLEQSRKNPDDSIEGDYLDVHIIDQRNETVGWIEISGTKLGKLPSVKVIKWLEVIAAIIGVAISIERNRVTSKKMG